MMAPPDAAALARSQAYCDELTGRAARNFYWGLKLLPKAKRAAMCTLYAYMRLLDDIADEEGGRSPQQRLEDLEAWRAWTNCALAGQPPDSDSPIWPAFAEMIRQYRIPAWVFEEAIAGQDQDLQPAAFGSFEQLRQYCVRVAGTVGVASIYIWEFEGGEATEAMAVDRGIAFQLTNVLRDLREDADRGRIYLPRDEMEAAGVKAEDLLASRASGGFERLMRQQVERAESYYTRSAGLEQRIARDSRPALVAMTSIYHSLLGKIAADPTRVLRERVSLSKFKKLCIGWRALWSR